MFKIKGEVIHGLGNGKKAGMPTANLDIKDLREDIEFGVYACYVYINDERHLGVCNVGSRPTVDNSKTVEVNIIDFDRDIYGLTITIELLELLRGIHKFNSLDEVKAQVDKDILRTKEILK